MAEQGWHFFIDRGGTFTDIVAITPDGRLLTHKLLSENPTVYADAALAGMLMGISTEDKNKTKNKTNGKKKRQQRSPAGGRPKKKATKAKASPHTANTSPNKIIHSQYFLGPASCPKHCVSGANFGGILAAENVQQCNPDDKNQRWLIHQVNGGGGEVIKAESPENAGRCLGVASHGGGDDNT